MKPAAVGSTDATCARQSCLLGSHSDGGSWVMRLGLFGGTFDPIHLGHLIMAEQCRESCALDRVWFVVAGAPPHKLGGRTAVTHRLEMVRIAVAGHPAFAVSEIEASRPGPHYSVETLESVHRDSPDDDLFFLIGADSLADLPSWREPARIAQLATIVVVNRPGIEEADPSNLPDLGPGSRRLVSVTIPQIGIASTDLRRRLAEGRSIRYLVPRGVEAYIEAQGLYRANTAKER
jgi:nicotinate-nucleotide adenylyltransferase